MRPLKWFLCVFAAAVPLFSQSTAPPFTITTASPLPGGAVQSPYSQTLSTANGLAPYTWAASGSLPPGLSLGATTGTIAGTPTQPGTFNFTVGAVDAQGRQASKPFSITVQPGPLTITTTSPAKAGVIGEPYSFTFDASGGFPPYTWRTSGGNLPDGLTLSAAGALSGTPTAAALFSFTIAVTPPGTVTKAFTLRITPPITVTTPSPIAATAGSPLTVVMTATGGLPPYLWFKASDSTLPPGFTLDAGSGFLGGTPPAAGTFNFAVQATDSAQNNGTKALSMVVAPPIAITTASSAPGGAAGVNYSLTLAATGGNAPFTWALDSGALPAGVTLNTSTGVISGSPQSGGTFSFVIRVTDIAKATITKPFTLTITPPTSQGSPLLSDTNLDFFGLAGGDSPAPQNFSLISSALPALQFTIQTDGGAANTPAPAWLSVKLTRGATPARIPVAVDQTGLPAGKYLARILLNTTGGRQSIVTVNLTLEAAAQKLDVSPGFLRFSGTPSPVSTLEQDLLVRNLGGGGSFAFRVSPFEGSAWLSVTPDVGQAGPNTPALIRVIVNTQSLPLGPRRGLIHIESSAGSADIPISLLVKESGPVIGVNQSGQRFESRQGNGHANTRNLNVLNLGQGSVNWRAELVSGADWLTLGADSGSSTPTVPSRLPLSANPGSLPSGAYYALIRITDPAASNSPQFLTAVLRVSDEASPPDPDPSPSGLFFVGKTGAPPPPSQPVRVFLSSTASVAFQASANASDNGTWISVDPVSGTTSTQGVAQVNVTVNPTNLRPGVYTGDVTFAFSSTLIRSTNITFVVQLATAGASDEKSRSVSGCTPTKLSLTQTGLVNSFAAPAGWPTPLIVRLADDCGDSVLNGQVTATFSNGDPSLPMRLTVPENGLYSATWAPGTVAGAVTVTARANAPNLDSTTAGISGSVTPNKVPVLFPNRVVNNLNGRNGDPLSPGLVAQVFGSNLSPTTGEPGVFPLRTTFSGTRVLVGAFAAPFYYLSDGQLNVQLPTELQADKEYSILVEANGGYTLPDSIFLAPARPGVLAFADRRLVAQRLDATGSLVSPQAPALQGEPLTLYLVGMGATEPTVASGQIAPTNPLAKVKTLPTVTIGGKTAALIYDPVMTPFFVGLYQIGIYVPTGISGDLPVIITQNGAEANATTLPVK